MSQHRKYVGPCQIEGCDRMAGAPGTARGMCHRHYRRWQRHGDPTAAAFESGRGDPLTRLKRHIVVTEVGCWHWQGAIGSHGYGQFLGPDGVVGLAHRISYELHIGPVPEGLQLDHLCRVRPCVNPAHLEPVTCAENLRRARAARKASAA